MRSKVAQARERNVLLWICALVGINQLGFGAIVPSLPLYARSFGVSTSAIGLAVGIYGLARMLLAAPAGGVSDRYGRRNALALGGIATTAGYLWCALANDFTSFLAARFLAGVGAGLIVTTGQIVLADISAPERRGRTMAIYMAVFIFAVGFGPLPGGLLSEHFGLVAPFYASAAAGTIAGLIAWFVIPETRDMARAKAAQVPGAARSYREQVWALAHNRGFVLVCLVNLMNTAVRTGGLFSVVPIIATERLHLSVDQVGLALALGLVGGLLCAYPSGMMVDYFGRKPVIVPSTLFSSASMLLFCVADSYLGFVLACLCWGTASSIGGSAPNAYAADVAPPGMNATTLSTYRMVGDAGYVAGPVLLGLLADRTDTITALVVVAAMLSVAGLMFGWLAPETYVGRRR